MELLRKTREVLSRDKYAQKWSQGMVETNIFVQASLSAQFSFWVPGPTQKSEVCLLMLSV